MLEELPTVLLSSRNSTDFIIGTLAKAQRIITCNHVPSLVAKKGIVLALVILLFAALPLGSSVVGAQTWHNLTGFVTFQDGSPVPGASVAAVNISNPSESYSVFTSSDGSYSLPVLHGTYDVTPTYTNYTGSTYRFIVSDDVDNVNFTMVEVLGTVTGHVTDGSGPVFGATVTLSSKTANYTANTTKQLGQYTFTNVTPGSYVAIAQKAGYEVETYPHPVEVERGVVTVVDFEMEGQPGRLFGNVTFGGARIAGAQVSVLSNNVEIAHATTNSSGGYTIVGLSAGTYTVTFSKEGYGSTSQVIQFSAFEERHLDGTLKADNLISGGGFVPGYDLPHSLMIVGFFLALVMVSVALFIRFKVSKKPDLLPKDEAED